MDLRHLGPMEVAVWANGYTLLFGCCCQSTYSEQSIRTVTPKFWLVTCDACARSPVFQAAREGQPHYPRLRVRKTVPLQQLRDGRFDIDANNERRAAVGLEPIVPDFASLSDLLAKQRRVFLDRAEQDLAAANEVLRGLMTRSWVDRTVEDQRRDARRVARLRLDDWWHLGPTSATQYADGFTLLSGAICEFAGRQVAGSSEENPDVLLRVFTRNPMEVTCPNCRNCKKFFSALRHFQEDGTLFPVRIDEVARMANRVVKAGGRYEVAANNLRREIAGLAPVYPEQAAIASLAEQERQIRIDYARRSVARLEHLLAAKRRWLAERLIGSVD